MPQYLRGPANQRNNLRFVRINPIFLYGWNTKDLAAASGVSAADLATQLGHLDTQAAEAVANRIMVTGANSPKPMRVVKRLANATVSAAASVNTFCAYNTLGAARQAGWRLTARSRGVSLRPVVDGQRSMTAVAELSNGLLYAFPLNTADYLEHGGNLGLEDASNINSTEAQRLVMGSRSKPGKAGILDGGAFTTFYSTAAEDGLVEGGYKKLSTEFVEHAAAAAPPAGGGGGGE